MEIPDKKVVVVGGASGMGRATAELLHARGAQVAILDREGSDGAAVAKSLDGWFFPVEVTDFELTEQALQAAVDALGGLHVTVTTAGGGYPGGRTLSKDGPHSLDLFRKTMDLNVVATFNICRLSAAHMAKNDPEDEERGVLINTSSIAAFEGQIGQVAYSAAKAAIAGMMLTMARDLGAVGIRALAIAPSLFDTGIIAKVPQERIQPLVAGNAFPVRMGRPSEYAKLAAAIVENPMLNGQCLRLDAGMRFSPK